MAAAAFPALRDELILHPGPVSADGAPSWTLHDPLRNQFFRLTWPAFEILSRWHLGSIEAIAEAVSEETTLRIDPQEVAGVVDSFAAGQLLRAGAPSDTARLLAIAAADKPSWMVWLLHHYLFFRVPLVRPDRILAKMLPSVAWLGSRAFRLATAAALLLGVYFVSRQWDVFVTTLVDHFSLAGLASFGITLTVAKILHELGHAFTAKSFRCRVPTMGVAFLVMMPVLYTDVNESWKLADRRQRLWVAGAGIATELALASWATLAWGFLPDGTMRGMAFTLAATTWISSLAINLSPFMRYDGYFLLMDGLDMPNLHARSFALARWWLRELLFDLGEPAPEPLPRKRRLLLIAFALGVWIYRLVLFLGIAALVYHYFFKLLGAFLLAVEVGWFVAKPFFNEFKEWRKRAGKIMKNRRSVISFGLLAALLLLAIIPWSGRIRAPASLKAANYAVLYPPLPARLLDINVHDGQSVTAGTVLAHLDSPDLGPKLIEADGRIAVLRHELASVSFNEKFRDDSPAIARQLEAAEAQHSAILADQARLTLVAPFDGIITGLASDQRIGQWLNPKDALMAVRTARGAVLDAYVTEDDLPRLAVGNAARFLPDSSSMALSATIDSIDRTAVRSLSEPALAVPFGGAIAARVSKQDLIPDVAIYRIRLAVSDITAVPTTRRGIAVISGQRRSLLGRVWRAAAAVLLREGGA